MGQLSIISTVDRIISHPTWDVVSLFALVAIGFFYGLSAGKRRIASTIIYTYMAYAIAMALPLAEWWGDKDPMDQFFLRAGAFLLFFLLLAFLLGSRRSKGFAPAGLWWQIFLLSFLQAGLLIHLVIEFMPHEKIKILAPFTRNLFANQSLHIWWLLLPAVVLIVLRRLESRSE